MRAELIYLLLSNACQENGACFAAALMKENKTIKWTQVKFCALEELLLAQ